MLNLTAQIAEKVGEWRALDEATTQETTQEIPNKILGLLKANPKLTQKQLAEKLDLTVDGVKYHLTKLKKQGTLQRIGSTKAGSWKVMG